MRIGVPRETAPGERRVAIVPETVGRLPGFEVAVERGAGLAAGYTDEAYEAAGAQRLYLQVLDLHDLEHLDVLADTLR